MNNTLKVGTVTISVVVLLIIFGSGGITGFASLILGKSGHINCNGESDTRFRFYEYDAACPKGPAIAILENNKPVAKEKYTVEPDTVFFLTPALSYWNDDVKFIKYDLGDEKPPIVIEATKENKKKAIPYKYEDEEACSFTVSMTYLDLEQKELKSKDGSVVKDVATLDLSGSDGESKCDCVPTTAKIAWLNSPDGEIQHWLFYENTYYLFPYTETSRLAVIGGSYFGSALDLTLEANDYKANSIGSRFVYEDYCVPTHMARKECEDLGVENLIGNDGRVYTEASAYYHSLEDSQVPTRTYEDDVCASDKIALAIIKYGKPIRLRDAAGCTDGERRCDTNPISCEFNVWKDLAPCPKNQYCINDGKCASMNKKTQSYEICTSDECEVVKIDYNIPVGGDSYTIEAGTTLTFTTELSTFSPKAVEGTITFGNGVHYSLLSEKSECVDAALSRSRDCRRNCYQGCQGPSCHDTTCPDRCTKVLEEDDAVCKAMTGSQESSVTFDLNPGLMRTFESTFENGCEEGLEDQSSFIGLGEEEIIGSDNNIIKVMDFSKSCDFNNKPKLCSGGSCGAGYLCNGGACVLDLEQGCSDEYCSNNAITRTGCFWNGQNYMAKCQSDLVCVGGGELVVNCVSPKFS